MASGAAIVPWLLRKLGARGFTSFTNFTNFLAHILWGAIPRPWAMFLAVVLATPGIDANSNTAITAMATDAAQALRTPRFPDGMGRGEYAGARSPFS